MRGPSRCWRAKGTQGHYKAQERPQQEEVKVQDLSLSLFSLGLGCHLLSLALPLALKNAGGGSDSHLASSWGLISLIASLGLAQNTCVKFAFF